MSEDPARQTDRLARTGRRALVLLLTAYGILILRTPETFRLIDNVDLAIHETGHLVFAPFGEFMTALGGSLFQLIMPAVFVAAFWRRGDRFAAYVTMWWVAQSSWNLSRYIGDAQAQALPLVGGGEHDWAYLLGSLGWLSKDAVIAGAVRSAGVLVFILGMLGAWMTAGNRQVSVHRQHRDS